MKSYFIVGMCLLMLTGCEGFDHSKAKVFYAKNSTSAEKRADIGHYSVPDQWDIYEYGLSKIEPPPVEMSEYLAQSGRPMLDFLIKEISTSHNDKAKTDAIFVFVHMQKNREYNICASTDYMAAIKKIGGEMRDEYSASVYNQQVGKMCAKYSY